MLRKRLSTQSKRLITAVIIVVLTLALAGRPQGTTFACEGAPGNCPCPGCG